MIWHKGMNASCHHAWVVGAGFLGGEMLRCCRAAGMRVLSIDERRPADVRGAMQSPDTQRVAMQMLRPDVIFCCTSSCGGNAAAYRHCYEEVAQTLACMLGDGKLVFCSTCSVYEEVAGAEVTEARPCPARREKMRIMLRAEQAVREVGGVVARLAALFGPGRCEVARRYIEGRESLPGAEFRWMNYVHVEDAARALLLLAECGEGGWVYNVCAETLLSAEFYRQMDKILPPRAATRAGLPAARGSHGRLHQRVCADRLRALGWCPRVRLIDFARRMFHDTSTRPGHAR